MNLPVRALLLGAVAWLVLVAVIFCALRAFAADYEIMAERPGAELRVDEPNVRRMGGTFPSRVDCLEAISLSRAEAGWRLRCRPVQRAPVPLLKADK